MVEIDAGVVRSAVSIYPTITPVATTIRALAGDR